MTPFSPAASRASSTHSVATNNGDYYDYYLLILRKSKLKLKKKKKTNINNKNYSAKQLPDTQRNADVRQTSDAGTHTDQTTLRGIVGSRLHRI